MGWDGILWLVGCFTYKSGMRWDGIIQYYIPDVGLILSSLNIQQRINPPNWSSWVTRGSLQVYPCRGSEFLIITGLHGSGFSLWCCEYLPQVLVRLSKVLFIYFTNFTYHYITHFNCYLPEHRAWMRKFPISDRFHEIHRSSLNTCPICIILSAFERCGHSQDNASFNNAKILFFLVLVGLISSILEGEYG